MKKQPIQTSDDKEVDIALRPSSWDEYVGQTKIKESVRLILEAAKQRGESCDHLLFYGQAGLGKTTLAYLIGREMGVNIKATSGPALEKAGDVAAILSNLEPHEILFIDEAHRINKLIEEVLYPALETRKLHLIIGKGPSARSIQLELPPFTLIAATTRVAMLSSPLRSRFSGGTFRLEFYTNEEVKKIITRSAGILGMEISGDSAEEIAKRSRYTPRIANHFLKRCRDFAQVHGGSGIDLNFAQKALDLMEIDELGLNNHDRRILNILIEKFKGGPVGLQTLAAATSEDEATIEEVYEPFLLQLGFIERTPRGRVATENAYKHLGQSQIQKNLL